VTRVRTELARNRSSISEKESKLFFCSENCGSEAHASRFSRDLFYWDRLKIEQLPVHGAAVRNAWSCAVPTPPRMLSWPGALSAMLGLLNPFLMFETFKK